MSAGPFTFYEFFAGGGMARLGLGPDWDCLFANEWRRKKAASYAAHFGGERLVVEDVAKLNPRDLPGAATLVWASFPCQDFSLAGAGAGLSGARSGTFKPFWKLIEDTAAANRAPRMVVLENVPGALTAHEGRDFSAIMDALAQAGYAAGAMVLDAARFLPQSCPRLFIVGVHGSFMAPQHLVLPSPDDAWHTRSVRVAYSRLPERLQRTWIWWRLPEPTTAPKPFSDLIEEEPAGVKWHSVEQTTRLISLMAPLHAAKLEEAMRLRRRIAGTIYRRTRNGVQRAEVRFDQISGCLRTPLGGSSRQIVIVVEGKQVRSRLQSPREAARLMGVPENYRLPGNYSDAYHLIGDGLVVPVVAWLEKHLLRPLAESDGARAA